MTTFKEIRGQLIRSVSSDPANPQEGQIWYNNTIGVLKGYLSIGGVWASGGSLNTARGNGGSSGTPTAAVYFGGAPLTTPTTSSATENYDGSTWTTSGALSTGRSEFDGTGTQTAALAVAGNTPGGGGPGLNLTNAVEEYNGSSWTAGGNYPVSIRQNAAFGVQTAAVSFGGNPAGSSVTTTNEYNGSTWTGSGALITSLRYVSGAGIESAGVALLGYSDGIPGIYATAQNYNGSSWTTGGTLNNSRFNGAASGSSSSDVFALGGGPSNNAELYDGTSFTAATSFTTARSASGATGITPTTNTLIFGGTTPTATAATEEYTDPTFGTQTLTTS